MNTSRRIIGLDEYGSDEELRAVELFVGYPEQLMNLKMVCYIIFIVIGVPSNLLTIVALARFKKILNATAMFIIHLSVVDFLFCALVLPVRMAVFWTRSWPFGRVLCRAFPLYNYALIGISLHTAVAIAINRYVLVCHPTYYCTIFTRRNIYIIIIIMWIFSFGRIFLPFFEVWGRMSLDPNMSACTIVPDKFNRDPRKVFIMVSLCLNVAVILCCYIRILLKVRKSVKKSVSRVPGAIQFDCTTDYYTNTLAEHRYSVSSSSGSSHASQDLNMSDLNAGAEVPDGQNQRKAVRKKLPSKKDKKLRTMVYAILLCLLICYVPTTFTNLLYTHIETLPTFNIISLILISAAPCINPILYASMSKEYRQAYKNLFCLKK